MRDTGTGVTAWARRALARLCADAEASIPLRGRGSFVFDGWAGPTVRVHYAAPDTVASDTPVLIVLHGVGRNGATYRNQWADLALARGALLLAPTFSKKRFPGARGYNRGHVRDAMGHQMPPERWSFAVIEPLFEMIRLAHALHTPSYAVYGHSAGAQFAHRFLFHVPNNRAARIVAANAGWYLLPTDNEPFPYGLNGSGIDLSALPSAFTRHLTVMLGTEDSDPDHWSLQRSAGAMRQGAHRLARGETFFRTAQSAAAMLNCAFHWRLETVAGVDHDNMGMAPMALPYLLD